VPPALPHVAAGRLRALAGCPRRADHRRHGAAWIRGSHLARRDGPAGTPEVVERLSSQGAEPIGSTPQAFAAYIRTETAKWAKVVRESGAKAE
jgi:hypothetical protein